MHGWVKWTFALLCHSSPSKVTCSRCQLREKGSLLQNLNLHTHVAMYPNPAIFVHIYKLIFSYLIGHIHIPYNRNIRRREILANRLNFPIGENLNWRDGILDHVTLWMP